MFGIPPATKSAGCQLARDTSASGARGAGVVQSAEKPARSMPRAPSIEQALWGGAMTRDTRTPVRRSNDSILRSACAAIAVNSATERARAKLFANDGRCRVRAARAAPVGSERATRPCARRARRREGSSPSQRDIRASRHVAQASGTKRVRSSVHGDLGRRSRSTLAGPTAAVLVTTWRKLTSGRRPKYRPGVRRSRKPSPSLELGRRATCPIDDRAGRRGSPDDVAPDPGEDGGPLLRGERAYRRAPSRRMCDRGTEPGRADPA